MAVENFELFPCTFRGVPFLIERHTTKAGRKTVTHEFPNSDKRYVEDLGQQLQTYNIRGLISGDLYFSNRDLLIRALSQPGIGILTHPFLGVKNVSLIHYTLEEKTETLGVAVFEMSFQESQINTSPQNILNKVPEIIQDIGFVSTSLKEQTQNEFNVQKNSQINFNSALGKINSIGDTFTRASNAYVNDPEFINSFSSTLISYKENSVLLVTDPQSLGEDNQELFNQVNDLAVAPNDGFNLMTTFFTYGDDDDPITENTTERINRLKNQEILNAQIQATALVLAYQNSVLDTYETIIDIQNRINILEDQYFKISTNEFINPDVLNNITDLRSKVIGFFRELELTTYKISKISTQTIPITILVYQYYGDVELTQNIVDLNNIKDVSFVSGDLEILTP